MNGKNITNKAGIYPLTKNNASKKISKRLLLKLSNILYLDKEFNGPLKSQLIICQSPLVHLLSLSI